MLFGISFNELFIITVAVTVAGGVLSLLDCCLDVSALVASVQLVTTKCVPCRVQEAVPAIFQIRRRVCGPCDRVCEEETRSGALQQHPAERAVSRATAARGRAGSAQYSSIRGQKPVSHPGRQVRCLTTAVRAQYKLVRGVRHC